MTQCVCLSSIQRDSSLILQKFFKFFGWRFFLMKDLSYKNIDDYVVCGNGARVQI